MNVRFLSMGLPLLVFSSSVFACNANQPESFAKFFQRFAGDKVFAMNRTVYPSSRVRYEYQLENGKQEITEFRRTVTKQEDMKHLPLQQYVTAFGLSVATPDVSPNDAIVQIASQAWQLSYHFALREGCWFLEEIQQHVM